MTELRVDSGMAGMCPIVPSGSIRAGYDLLPEMNYAAATASIWRIHG
jgi:hypothetical protein